MTRSLRTATHSEREEEARPSPLSPLGAPPQTPALRACPLPRVPAPPRAAESRCPALDDAAATGAGFPAT
eukprot:2664534-Prymnesium_polylepis.1